MAKLAIASTGDLPLVWLSRAELAPETIARRPIEGAPPQVDLVLGWVKGNCSPSGVSSSRVANQAQPLRHEPYDISESAFPSGPLLSERAIDHQLSGEGGHEKAGISFTSSAQHSRRPGERDP